MRGRYTAKGGEGVSELGGGGEVEAHRRGKRGGVGEVGREVDDTTDVAFGTRGTSETKEESKSAEQENSGT